MSRRTYNNFHNNYQQHYGHFPNNGMMYQSGYCESNDDYNYYTTGKFKTRRNNYSNVSQNSPHGYFANQSHGNLSLEMQYSNWSYNSVNYSNPNNRRNYIHHNAYTTVSRNTNQNCRAQPNNSNARRFVENKYNESGGADTSNIEAETSGDDLENTVDGTNSSENTSAVIDVERPSTRTVSKKSLREMTELQKQSRQQSAPLSYTDYWSKGKESDGEDFEEPEDPCYVLQAKSKKIQNQIKNRGKKSRKKVKPEVKKANEFEKKVNDMLSAPVEMNKGKSLLEKMGWNGGGLGKAGEGILEPIAPQVFYAGSTMGFGQFTKEDEETILVDHVFLRTLKVILEFVKNYLENELIFDQKLTGFERKRIHRTVEEMRSGVQNFPAPYKSVIMDIYHHNDYLLYTQSDGEMKTRRLTLYKEPHKHMYVILPEDLIKEVTAESKLVDNKLANLLLTRNVQVDENNSKEAGQSCECNDEVESQEFEECVESNEGDNVGQPELKANKENDNSTKEDSAIAEIAATTLEATSGIEEKIGNHSSLSENKPNVELEDDVKDECVENLKTSEEPKSLENVDAFVPIITMDNVEDKDKDKQKSSNNNIQNNIKISYTSTELVIPNMQNMSKRQIRRLRTKARNEEARKNKPKKVVIEDSKPKHENNKKEVDEILDLIIKYFVEFTEHELVTEFRFLGPFDHKERCAIDTFFDVCKGVHKIDRSQEVLDLFDSEDMYLEMMEDNNGRYVIYKIYKAKDTE